MKVSLKLLSRFVELPTNDQGQPECAIIARLLTKQGFEVEAIELFGASLNSVVVGKIVSAERHPNADKLHVCSVDLGQFGRKQIVCGAPNARVGLYVAAALPGSVLPGNLVIKESTIRDIASSGMLCSRQELGLPINDWDGDGIWELHSAESGGRVDVSDSHLGRPVLEVCDYHDTLLELNVTPNRPDALFHEGVARELFVALKFAGIRTNWKSFRPTNHVVKQAHEILKDVEHAKHVQTSDGIVIQAINHIEKPCFFIVVDGVTVKASPAWLRQDLERLGLNSVNNIVDISNYILCCFGQPSHAFDIDKLSVQNKKLEVQLRYGIDKETFCALDGKSPVLTAHDAVVSDAHGVHALLGVMGGEHSKVTVSTKRILVEFANPDPVLTRLTSRRHNRRTDASFLFEKGLDSAFRWNAAEYFLAGCAEWAGSPSYCGAFHSVSPAQKPCLDLRLGYALAKQLTPNPVHHVTVKAPKEFQLRYLGKPVCGLEQQEQILSWLGFIHLSTTETHVEYSVPHWRWLDVAWPACLAEEVARVVGIDHVAAVRVPECAKTMKDDLHLPLFQDVANRAVQMGYVEVAGLHFQHERALTKMKLSGPHALGRALQLLNPIIKDQPYLQTSLVPDLLEKVSFNLRHGTKAGSLFHIARTYQNQDRYGDVVFQRANLSQEDHALHLGADLFDYAPEHSLVFTQEQVQEGRPAETPRVAAVVFGVKETKEWWNSGEVLWSLHHVIAHALEICRVFSIEVDVSPMPSNYPMFPALHPHQAVVLKSSAGVSLGWVGVYHPQVMRAYDIAEQCMGFELNLACLFHQRPAFKHSEKRVVAARRFPTIHRDFAFVIEEDITASELVDSLKKSLARDLVNLNIPASCESLRVFDVYRGSGVPAGKKSVAFNLALEPLERTLTDHDIRAVTESIQRAMSANFNVVQRA